MRKSLKVILRVLPWVILLASAGYLWLAEGWKDLLVGRYHRKAHELFSQVDGVTEVKIFRLAGTEQQATQEKFSIKPYGMERTVYGSVTLKGDEAAAFTKLWKYQAPSIWRQALCHEPPYGFRLYRQGKIVAETSVCWHCSNYYVEVWPLGNNWYGFEADSENGKALLEFCDKRLPYLRVPEEQPEPKKKSS